jgi:hypothetical protein
LKIKNSLLTLSSGAMPKDAFLSLKKKTKNGILVTFPNQQKIKNFSFHPSTYSIPVPA